MNRDKNVIVFLESYGENRQSINVGLLCEGRRIAVALGGELSAMAVGTLEEDVHLLERYGVTTLYRVEGDRLSRYSCEIFAWAAARALIELPFHLLLFAQSDRGSELAPRVAFSLGRSFVSDCVDMKVEDGSIIYVRSVYGGQLQQDISYRSPGREIASIRCDVLDEESPTAPRLLQIHCILVDIPSDLASSTLIEVIPPDYRVVDIIFAKRIVGVGSGCADGRILSQVTELGSLLEGSVATTRPVVDEGLLPKERMIGQTGKTVAPEIYLALGISGSPHHVAGIQRSKTILSVNRDPKAPIFALSDAGFVCDLRSILPKLIDRIKSYRDEYAQETHKGKET